MVIDLGAKGPKRALVGRDRELGTLRGALVSAASGSGGLVLLAGEPGIGKTRLADELAHEALAMGCAVYWGRCWEGEGAPAYWPWIRILRAWLSDTQPDRIAATLDSQAGQIAQLVPELKPPARDTAVPEGLAPAFLRFLRGDALATVFKRIAEQRPLVLVLDDLQWADPDSLAVLHFLARELVSSRVLIVATLRDDELGATSAQRELGELAGAARSITLAGLSRVDAASLIAHLAGTDVGESFVAAVHGRCAGNPFFMQELVNLLKDESASSDPDALPFGVRETIRRRLARLPEASRRALSFAAVAGLHFDVKAVGLASGGPLAPDEAFVDMLEPAVRARLLTTDAVSGRGAFVHALVRDVLYDDLSTKQRAELHRRVAEAIEQLHREYLAPHLVALSDHFAKALAAGAVLKAQTYSAKAAERAAALRAFDDAARLYDRALELLETKDANDLARGELLLALTDVLMRAGHTARARLTARQAAAIARKLERRGEREVASRMLARAALAYGGPGLVTETGVSDSAAITLLEEALSELPLSDSPLRARLASRLAVELRYTKAPERCGELAIGAVAMARRLDDSATLAFALHAWHWALWEPANAEARLAAIEEMERAARAARDDALALTAVALRVPAALELGRRAGVDEALSLLDRSSSELQQPYFAWRALELRAMRALLDGRFDEGEALAHQALALGTRLEAPDAMQAFGVQLAWLRRVQDRSSEIADGFRSFVERYPAVPAWRCGLALMYLDLGMRDLAHIELEQIARRGFDHLPRDQHWLLTLAMLAELCVTLGDATRAERVAGLLAPFDGSNIVIGPGTVFYGPVARHLGALAALRGCREEAMEHFERALAACRHIGSPPLVALVQTDYASVLSGGSPNDRDKGRLMLATARATAMHLGMQRIVKRASLLDSAVERRGELVNALRHEGQFWTVRFNGTTTSMRDGKGLRYLAMLLRRPRKAFHVLDLVALIAPGPVDAQPLTRAPASTADARARAAYRERLESLDEELTEAREAKDIGRAAAVESEISFLTKELGRAYGIDGRVRDQSDPVEKARKAVTNRIRAAIAVVRTEHPQLAAHLALAVRTGTYCVYRPERAVRWTVDLNA